MSDRVRVTLPDRVGRRTFLTLATIGIGLPLLRRPVFAEEAAAVSSPDRLWKLSGALNTRDLGGYATQDGRRVAPGHIIRSCELSYLSEDGVRLLSTRNLSVVVDIRGTREAAAAPDKLPVGTRIVHSPIIGDELDQVEINRFLASSGLPETMQDAVAVNRLGPFYRMLKLVNSYGDNAFIERLGPGYRPLFEQLLLLPAGEALLFNDTGGRDRVGIAAALVLQALDVGMETITRDYLESNGNLQPDRRNPNSIVFEQFRYTPVYIQPVTNRRFQTVAQDFGTEPATIYNAVRLRPELLPTMFKAIPKRYGSMEAFQRTQLGLGAAELKELRRKFLV